MARRASFSVRKRSRRFFGLAIVCWCSAAVLFGGAAYDSVRRWQILHGISARAKVMKSFGVMRHGQMTYSLGIGFVDANGNQQLTEVPVTKQQVGQVTEGAWVPIRYRPDEPTSALLASDNVLRFRNVGALLAALGLGAVGRGHWRRWQREQQKLA